MKHWVFCENTATRPVVAGGTVTHRLLRSTIGEGAQMTDHYERKPGRLTQAGRWVRRHPFVTTFIVAFFSPPLFFTYAAIVHSYYMWLTPYLP